MTSLVVTSNPLARLTKRSRTGIASVSLLVLIWYLATGPLGLIDPIRFPTPAQTWQALVQIARDGYADATLAQHVLQSCKLVLMGFVAAVGLGVPLGMLTGFSSRADALIKPVFLLIRPIPPLAWIPLAIVWLGLGDAAKVMVIWFAAFVPAVINTHTGVRMIEPYLFEASEMLGIRKVAFVCEVLVPATLPMMFTGLRLALQASWTTLVAGELIGAIAGLGHVLTQSSLDIFPAMIVVAMAAVAVCGGLMTAALGMLEKRAMPWRQQT
jgi:NitT/TauT family transport system permease protein/taurine transport system permease protein